MRTSEKPADEHPPVFPAVVSIATVTVLAALIVIGFPDRSDYAGHFLAGAGATATMVAIVTSFVIVQRPGLVVGLCLAAVLAGVGTEATIFREAAFDWIDFSLQSSGAVLVSIPFLAGGGGPKGDLTFVAGIVMLVAGFSYAFA